MGCSVSVLGMRKKKPNIPEVSVFVPLMRIPAKSNIQRSLKGLVPNDLLDKLSSLRNQILLLTEDTDGSATTQIWPVLEEYLPVLIGLTEKDHGLEELVEFKWKTVTRHQEASLSNSWFELLSVIHMMTVLTLSEANSLLIPEEHLGSEIRTVSTDSKRDAVDLLLKASGYIEFCIHEILVRIPPETKRSLPKDLQEGILEALSIQALGQGTEIQLGLAMESQKASLSVKRRLACEQLSYFSQAYGCLSQCDLSHGYGKKHLWFIKWKFLEAKAAAYYYHGLIMDKGTDPSSSISAVCCFAAAEELLTESKKACLSFCLANPVSRIPPFWGSMKYLNQKIPEVALKKSQMYGYLLEQEKGLQVLPDLPEFQLSLRPNDYRLPEMDPAWDRESWEIESQTLKEHLKDQEDMY
ncbi:hypothetical protein SAY86_004475 [Trapa natans]|uniref:BRO1 domain-containing protein n=1 Tax=Trapa natans TaxID=22666 RepID=A0AAN7M7S5_TRANT|nr:hypothetical protein SAY86_004475 [Trapa natans]